MTTRCPLFLTVLTMLLLTSVVAAEQIELGWAFWGDNVDFEVNQHLAQRFEAENPEVTVTLHHLTQGYGDQLMTMIVGGVGPDIFMVAEWNFRGYAKDGLLTNLDPYIEKVGFDVDDFFPLVLQAYKYEGNQYGIPPRWGPMLLYYNTQLFDEAGVMRPHEEWTWDDFVDAGKKLTKGEGPDKQWGFGAVGGWWPWWMSPIYQNGGAILDETFSRAVYNTPEVEEALAWYQSLIWVHRIAPAPGDWQAYPGMGPDQLFSSGISAMNTTGFWAVGSLRKSGLGTWDVSTLPRKKTRATPLFSNAWSIYSGSKHKETAFQLVKFVTSQEGQAVIADLGLDVPTRLSVTSSDVFLRPGQPPQNIARILVMAQDLYIPPTFSERSGDIGNILGPEIDKLLNNEQSAKQLIDNTISRVRSILEK